MSDGGERLELLAVLDGSFVDDQQYMLYEFYCRTAGGQECRVLAAASACDDVALRELHRVHPMAFERELTWLQEAAGDADELHGDLEEVAANAESKRSAWRGGRRKKRLSDRSARAKGRSRKQKAPGSGSVDCNKNVRARAQRCVESSLHHDGFSPNSSNLSDDVKSQLRQADAEALVAKMLGPVPLDRKMRSLAQFRAALKFPAVERCSCAICGERVFVGDSFELALFDAVSAKDGTRIVDRLQSLLCVHAVLSKYKVCVWLKSHFSFNDVRLPCSIRIVKNRQRTCWMVFLFGLRLLIRSATQSIAASGVGMQRPAINCLDSQLPTISSLETFRRKSLT